MHRYTDAPEPPRTSSTRLTACSSTCVKSSVVLTAAPILGFGIFMPARTVTGTRKLEDILGFEEFLDKVDSDRFKRMITGPEMFEAYLPFAMALGLEKTADTLYISNIMEGDDAFLLLMDLSPVLDVIGEVTGGPYRLNHT